MLSYFKVFTFISCIFLRYMPCILIIFQQAPPSKSLQMSPPVTLSSKYGLFSINVICNPEAHGNRLKNQSVGNLPMANSQLKKNNFPARETINCQQLLSQVYLSHIHGVLFFIENIIALPQSITLGDIYYRPCRYPEFQVRPQRKTSNASSEPTHHLQHHTFPSSPYPNPQNWQKPTAILEDMPVSRIPEVTPVCRTSWATLNPIIPEAQRQCWNPNQQSLSRPQNHQQRHPMEPENLLVTR